MRKMIAITATACLTGLLLSGTAMAQSVSGSATVSGSTGGSTDGTVISGGLGTERPQAMSSSAGALA